MSRDAADFFSKTPKSFERLFVFKKKNIQVGYQIWDERPVQNFVYLYN